ncbi:MmcQ/YjbR family DNA-binding protein [Patescibacteria group bacterium]|nr:MmcQ/YjbR family DNA-binding protein [Patescibacteria group bacterium]
MIKSTDISRIKRYISQLQNCRKSYPYGAGLTVYSIQSEPFAYIEKSKSIMRLSLRADSELAKLLKERYEEVLPAQRLDPRKWYTIILSGQLSIDEIMALIDHSYQLAADAAMHNLN